MSCRRAGTEVLLKIKCLLKCREIGVGVYEKNDIGICSPVCHRYSSNV